MSHIIAAPHKIAEISINELLEKPFLSRTLHEQIGIVQQGKPRPRLETVVCLKTNLTWCGNAIYEQNEWLTACDRKQALYCWPCVLFGRNKNVFNTRGVLFGLEGRDVNDPYTGTEAHERCIDHIHAMFDMEMFIRQTTVQSALSDYQHNELVKRNRDIMKRIIDVACLVLSQVKPPRHGSYEKNQLKVDECFQTLKFLQVYDYQEDNIVQDAMDLLEISPEIVNNIVDALKALVKSSILNEIQQSAFVSMILSQHSISSDGKLKISTVLRYLKNGCVCERFIGFHVFDESFTHYSIVQHIYTITSEYNISQRLLSLAIDGAVLRKRQYLSLFLKDFKNAFPYTSFVPCHFHNFYGVLQDSLSVFTVCDTFFKALTAMGIFLENNRSRTLGFKCFIESKVSEMGEFVFGNSSNSLNKMKMLRPHLIELFNFMLQNCEDLKPDDLSEVYGYRQFLTDTKTVFLLEVFIKLFKITDDINAVLGSETPERAFDYCMVSQAQKFFASEKEFGFDQVWSSFLTEVQSKVFEDSELAYHRAVFLDLVDLLHSQVNLRLEHLKQFEFFNLFNFSWESRTKYTSPRVLVALVIAVYGGSFHSPSLLADIQSIYERDSFLIGRSVEQFYQYFVSSNKQSQYKNLYKLTELVLTMPCKPPLSTSSLSLLDKIRKWCYTPTKFSGDFSVLCVEENCFLDIKRKKSFYDDVIRKFQEINSTIDFLNYKEY